MLTFQVKILRRHEQGASGNSNHALTGLCNLFVRIETAKAPELPETAGKHWGGPLVLAAELNLLFQDFALMLMCE